MKRVFPYLFLFLIIFPLGVSAQLTFQFDSIIPSPQTAGDSFAVYVSCSDPSFTNWVYIDLHPGGQTYMDPSQILIQNGTGSGYVTIYRTQNPCSLSVYLVSGDRFYSNSFAVNANVPERLQAILPGESPDPGRMPSGRTGQPDFQTAGIAFDVDVYITDYWWNPVGFGNDTIHFDSDNSFPILPPDTTLTSGMGQFSAILRTACDVTDPSTYYHLYVSHITGDTAFLPDTTTRFAVQPGNFTKLLLLAPTQSILAGDTVVNNSLMPGATPDTTDWQVAGSPFDVSVYAVDDCWNPVQGAAPQDSIRIYGTIGPATIADTSVLTNGNTTVSLNCNLSGFLYLQAEDIDDPTKTTQYYTSVKIAGAHYRLTADEEEDTIVSGDPIHLHITYEDENNNTITWDDHEIAIYVEQGSGSLIPTDTIKRDLTTGTVDLTVHYTTMQAEELFLEVAAEEPTRLSQPGKNQNAIYVRPNITPNEPVVNYPNPFGSEQKTTTIYYYLERNCDVKISIYDRFGNLVRKWKKSGQTGDNFLSWDGTNDRGTRVANGAYLLAIRATDRTVVVHDYRRWIAVVK